MQPYISIIIPVFNSHVYLDRCFSSIQSQTLREIEIIFVDDGSTDKSASMLDDFAKRDKRVKVISQVNKGTGEARNQGIRNASGHYIAFMDSDDSADKEMLRYLFQKAKFDNDIVVCGHHEILLNGKVRAHLFPEGYKSEQYFNDIVSLNRSSPVWAKIYHRDLFEHKRCFFSLNNRNNEDNATLLKLLYYSKSVSFVSKPLYSWFRSVGSKSQSINALRITETVNVMKLRKVFLTENNLLEKYSLAFLRSILRTIKVRFSNIQKFTIGNESDVLLRQFYQTLYQSQLLSEDTLHYLKLHIPAEYWELIYRAIDDSKIVNQTDFVTLFSQEDMAFAKANFEGGENPKLVSLMKSIKEIEANNLYIYGVGDTWLKLKKLLPKSKSITGFIDKKFENKEGKQKNEFTLKEAFSVMEASSSIVVASLAQIEEILSEIRRTAKLYNFQPTIVTFYGIDANQRNKIDE